MTLWETQWQELKDADTDEGTHHNISKGMVDPE